MGAVASWHDGSIGGETMKKKVIPINPGEIESKAINLMSLIKNNEERKPADQVDHTVSVIKEDDIGVMICGSAHRLEDCFVKLIQQRPELYYVIDRALSRYAHKGIY